MNDDKELTGGEATAYKEGREDSADLDILGKSDSEEAAKERGEEDRIGAETTKTENDSDAE